MAGTAVIKKKEKKEEKFLEKVANDIWDVYHEMYLFVAGGV